ncbi:MAG TPA: PD-(D/E)XK motif protein [Galbitalea sp.]
MFEFADRVVEQFLELFDVQPENPFELRGQIAAGRDSDVLAVQGDGSAYILIRIEDGGTRALAQAFDALRVIPRGSYAVELPAGPIVRTYCAIALSGDRRELLAAFSMVGAALLASLPQNPSTTQVEEFVSAYVDMFSTRARPNVSTIKGIWGELWLINRSVAKSELLEAWHPSATATFDFTFVDKEVEVKTHEGFRSVHHFSHSQLTTGRDAFVVSLGIIEDPSGLSIANLLDEISIDFSLRERMMLARKTFNSLGFEVEGTEDYRYRVMDPNGRIVVAAQKVPTVHVPRLEPIYDVSYAVDISAALEAFGRPLQELLPSLL